MKEFFSFVFIHFVSKGKQEVYNWEYLHYSVIEKLSCFTTCIIYIIFLLLRNNETLVSFKNFIVFSKLKTTLKT